MTILDRAGNYVARLLGPEDGFDGWQIVEQRGNAERASLVTMNRSRLLEAWRAGVLYWPRNS